MYCVVMKYTTEDVLSKVRDLVTITSRLLDRCGVKYKLAVQQVRKTSGAIGGHEAIYSLILTRAYFSLNGNLFSRVYR